MAMSGYPVRLTDKPNCYYVICDCGEKVYFYTNPDTGRWDSVQHGENPEHTFLCVQKEPLEDDDDIQVCLETDTIWIAYEIESTRIESRVSGKWIDAIHEREISKAT